MMSRLRRCPKGLAALSRSTSVKPPALPEVADSKSTKTAATKMYKRFKAKVFLVHLCLLAATEIVKMLQVYLWLNPLFSVPVFRSSRLKNVTPIRGNGVFRFSVFYFFKTAAPA
jgi:hypothetical protein